MNNQTELVKAPFLSQNSKARNHVKCDLKRLAYSLIGLFVFAAILTISLYHNYGDANGSSPIQKRSLRSRLKWAIANSKPRCAHGFVGQMCEIECGLSFAKPNLKIVGGTVATANSWPAHALILGCAGDSNDCSMCGGTLIDQETVLTAAHCIQNPPVSYSVYLGLHDILTLSKANISPAVKMQVKSIIKHSNYDDATLSNDIALFILSSKAPLNNYIQVACLPGAISSNYPTQNESWSVGWGHTSFEGSSPNRLNNVKLSVYSNTSFCKEVSPSVAKNWNKQICAGEIAGGKDTCQGDSGGPLYVLDKVGNKTKYVMSGIVSYGDVCAAVGKPGHLFNQSIYTRVSNYLDWIVDNSPTLPNFITNSSNNLLKQSNLKMCFFILMVLLFIF